MTSFRVCMLFVALCAFSSVLAVPMRLFFEPKVHLDPMYEYDTDMHSPKAMSADLWEESSSPDAWDDRSSPFSDDSVLLQDMLDDELKNHFPELEHMQVKQPIAGRSVAAPVRLVPEPRMPTVYKREPLREEDLLSDETLEPEVTPAELLARLAALVQFQHVELQEVVWLLAVKQVALSRGLHLRGSVRMWQLYKRLLVPCVGQECERLLVEMRVWVQHAVGWLYPGCKDVSEFMGYAVDELEAASALSKNNMKKVFKAEMF